MATPLKYVHVVSGIADIPFPMEMGRLEQQNGTEWQRQWEGQYICYTG